MLLQTPLSALFVLPQMLLFFSAFLLVIFRRQLRTLAISSLFLWIVLWQALLKTPLLSSWRDSLFFLPFALFFLFSFLSFFPSLAKIVLSWNSVPSACSLPPTFLVFYVLTVMASSTMISSAASLFLTLLPALHLRKAFLQTFAAQAQLDGSCCIFYRISPISPRPSNEIRPFLSQFFLFLAFCPLDQDLVPRAPTPVGRSPQRFFANDLSTLPAERLREGTLFPCFLKHPPGCGMVPRGPFLRISGPFSNTLSGVLPFSFPASFFCTLATSAVASGTRFSFYFTPAPLPGIRDLHPPLFDFSDMASSTA